MDKERVLSEIRFNIRNDKIVLASQQILELANAYSDDPFTLLTCVSLLKVIEQDKGAKNVVDTIVKIATESNGLEVAKGLRRIGFPKDAETILSKTADSDHTFRERMLISFDLGRYSDCVAFYEKLSDPALSDTVVMIDALSASKEHSKAVDLAKKLLAEAPNDLLVQKCYCSALISAGKTKDAVKFIKDNLKTNKDSSDADALASFVLWVEGKSTSAGAYATKAIKSDPGNVLAMEILAYSLIEKKKYPEAKIAAGAINEKDPGNPAVIRILDMCKGKK